MWFVCLAVNAIGQGILPDWMGKMESIIANQTVSDLSLPGTHDTFTYDLSTVVSDGGDDGSAELSWLLHTFKGLVPGSWIREQSVTHRSTITQQLDAGVRFLDFRIMYTGEEPTANAKKDWFSLHFLQTNNKAMVYFNEVRKWLDAHPKEVIVMWLSKHGAECAVGEDQFPGVPLELKQNYWNEIKKVFDGVLLDARKYPVNTTTYSDLIKYNQRVVIYASDWIEFTNSDTSVYDGCWVENHHGGGNERKGSVTWAMRELELASLIKKNQSLTNRFFLLSLAAIAPGAQLQLAFELKFLPNVDTKKHTEKCAALFMIPNMTAWCPESLVAMSQLTNYYNQIAFEQAYKQKWDFPNAIYLDALDADGTVRTGTTDLTGATTKYAYAATMLLANVRRVCKDSLAGDCGLIRADLERQREANPASFWDEPERGRLTNWPQL